MLSKHMQSVLRSAIWRSAEECYQVPLTARRSWRSINALRARGLLQWRAFDRSLALILTDQGEQMRYELLHG